MNIQIENDTKKVPFGDLKDGDIFLKGNTLFLKRPEINSRDGILNGMNAVYLSTGTMQGFSFDVMVTPVKRMVAYLS